VNNPAVQVAVAVAQAIALLMSVAFITYVLIIVVPFSRYRPRRPGNPNLAPVRAGAERGTRDR